MSAKNVSLLIFLFGFSLLLMAAAPNIPPHLDRQKVAYGCGTCHVSFNLMTGGGPEMCVSCHGPSSNQPNGSLVPGIKLKDIETEFKKTYRHPTFDARGVHRSTETLPETDPRAPRHADCADCHNPHFVNPVNRFAGIKGKRIGNLTADISHEYELCYNCHGDSANLPGRYTNKRAELSLNNPSFHPVEGEGKNLAVISLLRPYKEKKVAPNDVSVIKCADCHGSDNPASPSGPHGSNFQYILVDNYSTKDNQPESPYTYALCYRCHSRTSILANESFKFHASHIQGISQGLANGTSCYTCHNSHGSLDNRYLIKFNPAVVTPNARGLLKFAEKGISTFQGECYLSCHGVDHDPKSY